MEKYCFFTTNTIFGDLCWPTRIKMEYFFITAHTHPVLFFFILCETVSHLLFYISYVIIILHMIITLFHDENKNFKSWSFHMMETMFSISAPHCHSL